MCVGLCHDLGDSLVSGSKNKKIKKKDNTEIRRKLSGRTTDTKITEQNNYFIL